MREFYTNISNADMYTTCGQNIICISYDTKTKKGNIIFEKDINYKEFSNFFITYKDEYNNSKYIKITTPKLLIEDKVIKGQILYTFEFNQLWIKTFDENNKQISFECYQ